MKVGDLVTVKPARINKYIVVERLSHEGPRLSLWMLSDGEGSFPMTQRFMEVISESR